MHAQGFDDRIDAVADHAEHVIHVPCEQRLHNDVGSRGLGRRVERRLVVTIGGLALWRPIDLRRCESRREQARSAHGCGPSRLLKYMSAEAAFL